METHTHCFAVTFASGFTRHVTARSAQGATRCAVSANKLVGPRSRRNGDLTPLLTKDLYHCGTSDTRTCPMCNPKGTLFPLTADQE